MPNPNPTAPPPGTVRDHAAVEMARQVLADVTANPTHLQPNMSRPELAARTDRLTDALELLVEHVDLMHERADLLEKIAQHEQAARETRAELDVQTPPVSDTEALARAYTDALTIADNIATKWDRETGDYTATVWQRMICMDAVADSPSEALTEATQHLRKFLQDGTR